MKKLIISLITGIILLGACAKIEDLTVVNSTKGDEIAFTSRNGVATKAIVDTTAMVDHFGVYGYVVPGTYSANGGYLMKNAEYDENGDAANGAHYYWPKSDNNEGIDFIFTSYSQFDGNVEWANDTLKVNIPTLTQALIDDPDDFDDVLWAQSAYNHHQNGNVGVDHERVVLNFKHALSWLQFRGEVKNANVKWVKVKQISFGEYRDSIPGTPGTPYQPAIPAVNDTSYTWNVRISTGIACRSTYPTVVPITDEDIAYINSWFTSSIGTWPTSSNAGYFIVTPVTENIPDAYKTTVTTVSNKKITVFDARKYLNTQHPGTNWGGNWGEDAQYGHIITHLDKPNNYHRAWALNPFQNEIETITEITPGQPEVPAVPGVDPVPACGSIGLYTDGSILLPTASLISETPKATYGTQKDTTLNYVSAQVDTIFTNNHLILGNALIVPQAVPEKITIVFDICISNPSGDDVVFTDRKITRTINSGQDADGDATYTNYWEASSKYIYHFKFDGDVLDFSTSIAGWSVAATNEYHVWDY